MQQRRICETPNLQGKFRNRVYVALLPVPVEAVRAIKPWVDEAGCRKRFAGRNLGKACAENSCQQSKCHQLVKSAGDGTEILPAAGAR
jgi:hypothetical protein